MNVTLRKHLAEARADLQALEHDRLQISLLAEKRRKELQSVHYPDREQRLSLEMRASQTADYLRRHDEDVATARARYQKILTQYQQSGAAAEDQRWLDAATRRHGELVETYRADLRAAIDAFQARLAKARAVSTELATLEDEILNVTAQAGLKAPMNHRGWPDFGLPLGPNPGQLRDFILHTEEYPELESGFDRVILDFLYRAMFVAGVSTGKPRREARKIAEVA